MFDEYGALSNGTRIFWSISDGSIAENKLYYLVWSNFIRVSIYYEIKAINRSDLNVLL